MFFQMNDLEEAILSQDEEWQVPSFLKDYKKDDEDQTGHSGYWCPLERGEHLLGS